MCGIVRLQPQSYLRCYIPLSTLYAKIDPEPPETCTLITVHQKATVHLSSLTLSSVELCSESISPGTLHVDPRPKRYPFL
jgi:hypothetical protein